MLSLKKEATAVASCGNFIVYFINDGIQGD